MMINVVANTSLSSAQTALHVLKSNDLNNQNKTAGNDLKQLSNVGPAFSVRIAVATADMVSRIQELVAGKLDFSNVSFQSGWACFDIVRNLHDAFVESATVLDDGTMIANPGISDDELKQILIEVMKMYIARGDVGDDPEFVKAIQSGNFTIVIGPEMENDPIFLQGRFKKFSDGYGFMGDRGSISQADRDRMEAFYASGKRAVEAALGPVRFGFIF